MLNLNQVSPQRRAVTRRKIPGGSLADQIYSELPYYNDRVQQQRSQALSLQRLAQQKEDAQRLEALQQEQLDANRSQGNIATGISALGTVASLAKPAYSLLAGGGGSAAASAAPGAATTLSGMGLGGAGGSGLGAGASLAAQGAGVGAAASATPTLSGIGLSAGGGSALGGAGAGAGAGTSLFGSTTGGATLGTAGIGSIAGPVGVLAAVFAAFWALDSLIGPTHTGKSAHEQIEGASRGERWDEDSQSWYKSDFWGTPEGQERLRYLLQSMGDPNKQINATPDDLEADFRWNAGRYGWDPDTMKYTGDKKTDMGDAPWKTRSGPDMSGWTG